MSSLKPILVYGEYASPNPCKIRIILEELDIPYQIELVEMNEVKGDRYLKINPNGRIPSIYDPNTDVTLWETAAITNYLVEQYDKDHKLSYGSIPKKYQIQQWIAFQTSGQGPYYGQAVWFNFIHPDKFPSAIDRFEKEIERVRSVLDSHLSQRSKHGSETWLVGDKCTVADLSWVMWEHIADFVLEQKGIKIRGKYPAYDAWINRLFERPASRKQIAGRAEAMSKGAIKHAIRDDMKGSLNQAVELNKK